MKLLKNLILVIIAIIILGGVAIAILYQNRNKEKTEFTNDVRKNSSGSYVTLSEGQTHYEADGQDSGKVVILIHGFSVPYYIWDGTFEYLVDQGFKVIRYDMYGRGFSDRVDAVYNKQLYMDQLKQLIEKLGLKQPVSLAGVSFGGVVAADFTCAYPDMVSKVILVDPAYNLTKPAIPAFLTDVHDAITADDKANSQLTDFKYPDKHSNWVDLYLPQMEYKGFRRALITTQYNYTFNGREGYACLNSQNKPVMLIWGKDDKTVSFAYADSVKAVLKTEFLSVDDSGHLPHIEQAETVNTAIAAFLKK